VEFPLLLLVANINLILAGAGALSVSSFIKPAAGSRAKLESGLPPQKPIT